MHTIHKQLPQYQTDYTQDFDSAFRPLAQPVDHDTSFVHHQQRLDPYWEDHI